MTDREPGSEKRMLTIGHSNHPIDRFLELLRQHLVEVVVDARSHPISKFAPHFDSESLKKALTERGLHYLHMGRELGGRPKGDEFYDQDGHVLYDKVAQSPVFLEGVSRLEKGIRDYRVALLCSEENPAACHRRLLISRVLEQRGVTVFHIRGDGRVQSEAEVAVECGSDDANQLALFEQVEAPQWKSIPSVSQRKRQSSSSVF